MSDEGVTVHLRAVFPDPDTLRAFIIYVRAFERSRPECKLEIDTDVIAERDAWLEHFERRKAELVAAGKTPEAAEQIALTETRAAIRATGFRQH